MQQTWQTIGFVVIILAVAAFLYRKYRVAPSLDLTQLSAENLEGEAIDWSTYEGKALVIKYFATWCGDCREELPSYLQAAADLKGEPVRFLLLSDEKPQRLQILENEEIGVEIIRLRNSFRENGIHSIPTSYILDSKGKVVYRHVGQKDWSSDEMKKKVASAILR